MLHLNENPQGAQIIRTRVQKISNFLEYIDSKCRENFVSGTSILYPIKLSVSIVKFKGKMSFITYNPQKPTKEGIHIYVLADANIGYIQTILPYYGSFTTEKLVKPDLQSKIRINQLTGYRKLVKIFERYKKDKCIIARFRYGNEWKRR